MKKILDAKLGLHILELEITSRCNLNCQHCYNRSGKNTDMPIAQIKQLYNFAKKNSVWTFIISGGEAILHPEFSKILNLLKNRNDGVRLILQSNGELIKEDMFDCLRIFDWIHLSFDWSREIRDNGWKNLALAQSLKKVGINAYLFATIHNKNKDDLVNIVKMANRVDIPIGFNLCMPAGNLDERLLMSKKDYELIEKKLYKLSFEKKILRYSSPLSSIIDLKKGCKFNGIKGGCTAGIAACVIAPDGDVYPCPFFRIKAGNINKNTLRNIWLNSKLLNIIRDRKSYNEPCGNCDRLAYCGGCRSRSYFKEKNIRASDPMCYKYKK